MGNGKTSEAGGFWNGKTGGDERTCGWKDLGLLGWDVRMEHSGREDLETGLEELAAGRGVLLRGPLIRTWKYAKRVPGAGPACDKVRCLETPSDQVRIVHRA